MRLRVPAVTAMVVALAVAPASAFGSTTIGDVETPPTISGPAGQLYIPTADPTGHGYAVPAGGGVVTSVSGWLEASSAATARVFMVRGTAPSYLVLGGGTLSIAGTGTFEKATAATRIPVQEGDRVAVATPSSGGATVGATNVSGTVRFGAGQVPADGATINTSSGFNDQANAAMSIAAVVEPDADHDGYGDETQDSCPDKPAIHAGGCTSDLRTTATATPTAVKQGDVTTVVATVQNAGDPTAAAATATLTLPAGVQVVAASTTGGECTGTTCALGDVPGGATRKVFLVVRGTAPGAHALTIGATSADDVAHDNDAATVTISVAAPAQVAKPVKLCTVPSLAGKTATAARRALKKAGCGFGRVTGSRSKKARVRSQTIPRRVKVVAGTKVGMTLAVPKKRHR